jgi:hypothetical protein
MEAIRIEILDSKAMQFLKGLQELKLIKLSVEPSSQVKAYLKKMRRNAASAPTLDEITAIVEEVRAERHAKEK